MQYLPPHRPAKRHCTYRRRSNSAWQNVTTALAVLTAVIATLAYLHIADVNDSLMQSPQCVPLSVDSAEYY